MSLSRLPFAVPLCCSSVCSLGGHSTVSDEWIWICKCNAACCFSFHRSLFLTLFLFLFLSASLPPLWAVCSFLGITCFTFCSSSSLGDDFYKVAKKDNCESLNDVTQLVKLQMTHRLPFNETREETLLLSWDEESTELIVHLQLNCSCSSTKNLSSISSFFCLAPSIGSLINIDFSLLFFFSFTLLSLAALLFSRRSIISLLTCMKYALMQWPSSDTFSLDAIKLLNNHPVSFLMARQSLWKRSAILLLSAVVVSPSERFTSLSLSVFLSFCLTLCVLTFFSSSSVSRVDRLIRLQMHRVRRRLHEASWSRYIHITQLSEQLQEKCHIQFIETSGSFSSAKWIR